MNFLQRAGLTGVSAAMTLLAALPAMPAAAANSYDIAISDAAATEGSALTFNVNVTWVGAHHPAFTVNYTTAVSGTASASDFTATAGVLNVARDATLATITVPTTQDNIFEPDETFTVVLDPLSTTANVTDAEGLGTILNNDQVPRLTIGDATVTEGNDPAVYVDAVFDVALSNPASQDVTVKFRTAADTATGNDVDFKGKDDTLTFPAETNATQQITVKVKGDTIHEGDEQFFVNLSNAVNASILDGQGVGTIRDNDAVPVVSVPAGPTNFVEGNNEHDIKLAASLNHATTSDVTFTYKTQNGNAVGGSDFKDVTGTLVTIPAGSLSVDLPVTILGDLRFEGPENLYVEIDGATNASLGNQVGEVNLTNDDPIIIIGPGLP
jgi:Calx-beta domain